MSLNDRFSPLDLNDISRTADQINAADKVYLIGEVLNISAAAVTWVVSPVAGTITNIRTVIDTAITVADAGVTLELGGTEVTGSKVTIAHSGSAAGTTDSATPTALNTVAAGDAIEIVADGGSTDASKAVVLIEITPS